MILLTLDSRWFTVCLTQGVKGAIAKLFVCICGVVSRIYIYMCACVCVFALVQSTHLANSLISEVVLIIVFWNRRGWSWETCMWINVTERLDIPAPLSIFDTHSQIISEFPHIPRLKLSILLIPSGLTSTPQNFSKSSGMWTYKLNINIWLWPTHQPPSKSILLLTVPFLRGEQCKKSWPPPR